MKEQIRIGLFGYGVVGSGFYKLVQQMGGARIDRIAVKHPYLHQDITPDVLAATMYDIILDENIDVVVEAIDDEDAAFHIVKLSLEQGKPVVTANKKMIASRLPEIIALQQEFGIPVLYEAACCAGVPIVRSLQEYYSPGLTRKVSGIINGSTNYILTAMERYRFRFDHALQLAQEAGFAESDASLDVEGKDASCKLSIILKHLWGIYKAPETIIHTGIQNILPQDLKLAEQLGGILKLVANTQKIGDRKFTAFILPKLIQKQDVLFTVAHEYNGVVIEDILGDTHLLYGKGSGASPTAMGLWNDLEAWNRGYQYCYKENKLLEEDRSLEIIVHVALTGNVSLPAHIQLKEYVRDSRCVYYTGKLSLKELGDNDWWKQDGVSLIDLSDISAEDEDELVEKLQTAVALQRDIFQPV